MIKRDLMKVANMIYLAQINQVICTFWPLTEWFDATEEQLETQDVNTIQRIEGNVGLEWAKSLLALDWNME